MISGILILMRLAAYIMLVSLGESGDGDESSVGSAESIEKR